MGACLWFRRVLGNMAEGLNDTGTLAGSFYNLISKLEGERLGLAWAFESLKYTTSNTCPILKSVPAARGQALKQMSLWGPFSLKPPSSLPTLSVETGCLVEYGAHWFGQAGWQTNFRDTDSLKQSWNPSFMWVIEIRSQVVILVLPLEPFLHPIASSFCSH